MKSKSSLNLVTSIVTFILGAILFAKSEEVFNIITIAVGVILILYAVVTILSYKRNLKLGFNDPTKIMSSVVAIVFAVIFLFFNKIVYSAFNFITGGWILFIGINRLIKAITHKRLPQFITSIIMIALSIYVILNGTYLFLDALGVIIMVYSGIDIINYILYGKEDAEEEVRKTQKDGSELIIPKKEKRLLLRNKNKVKDVDPE